MSLLLHPLLGYLKYLYSVMANCLISNKVKNFNSHIAARGDNRQWQRNVHTFRNVIHVVRRYYMYLYW